MWKALRGGGKGIKKSEEHAGFDLCDMCDVTEIPFWEGQPQQRWATHFGQERVSFLRKVPA
jgi:hypothetical protein